MLLVVCVLSRASEAGAVLSAHELSSPFGPVESLHGALSDGTDLSRRRAVGVLACWEVSKVDGPRPYLGSNPIMAQSSNGVTS